MKDESIEEFELSKAEIADHRRRVAFFSDDSHPYVGLLDHSNVISSISNS